MRRHQLGPLIYRHLVSMGDVQCGSLGFALRADFVRCRYAERIRAEALEEFAAEGKRRGLEFLLLKGAATARLVYPDPALRPMKDLDVLVRATQIELAGQILREAGYRQRPQKGREVKHISPFLRRDRGVLIVIELHYDLFEGFWNRSCSWEDLGSDRARFSIGSEAMEALPLESMMWHTWCHLLEEQVLRLIWIADLVGCAERFADRLDWIFLRNEAPGLMTLLGMVADRAGLSPEVREQLGRTLPLPDGLEDCQIKGWPRSRASDWTGRRLQFFCETVWPTRASLGIWHGEKSRWDRFLNRWWFHPLQLFIWLLRRVRIRFEG